MRKPTALVIARSRPRRERVESREHGICIRIAKLHTVSPRHGCAAAEIPLGPVLPGNVTCPAGNSYILVHAILHWPSPIKTVPCVVKAVLRRCRHDTVSKIASRARATYGPRHKWSSRTTRRCGRDIPATEVAALETSVDAKQYGEVP